MQPVKQVSHWQFFVLANPALRLPNLVSLLEAWSGIWTSSWWSPAHPRPQPFCFTTDSNNQTLKHPTGAYPQVPVHFYYGHLCSQIQTNNLPTRDYMPLFWENGLSERESGSYLSLCLRAGLARDPTHPGWRWPSWLWKWAFPRNLKYLQGYMEPIKRGDLWVIKIIPGDTKGNKTSVWAGITAVWEWSV